jgi:putative endonuclease
MQEEKHPAVYIMSNGPRGTTYVGVTSSLWDRVATHKDAGLVGFTTKHDIKGLVWYEHHHTMEGAIRREKQIKKWNRDWKVKMIEAFNPNWIDLHDDIDPLKFYTEPQLDSRLRGNDDVVG